MPSAKHLLSSTKVTDVKRQEVHLNHRNKPADNKRNEVTIMGWAKYEEDNREALEERWAMRNTYSPAPVYSSYTGRSNQSTTRPPVYAYPQQKTNTPYTYRSVR